MQETRSPASAAFAIVNPKYKLATVERANELRERFNPPWTITGETWDMRLDRSSGYVDAPLRLTEWEWNNAVTGGLIRHYRFVATRVFNRECNCKRNPSRGFYGGYCAFGEVMLRRSVSVHSFADHTNDCDAVSRKMARFLVRHDALVIDEFQATTMLKP